MSEEIRIQKKVLMALLDLNKTLASGQYRMLALKTHHQKKVKIIKPDDPLFFYLN